MSQRVPPQALLDQFRTEVDNRSAEIDEYNEYDWLSLTLGWALAKGLHPSDARDFAVYVRYSTDMA